MARKSAKMVKIGHYVGLVDEHESRVVDVRHITSEKLGEIVEIHLENGDVMRRTPGAKVHVTRLK